MVTARHALAAVTALALVAAPTAALAQPRTVAVAPLSTLGTEVSTGEAKRLAGEIESALASLPDTKVIGSGPVVEAIKRAKQPQLRACDGDPACLKDLGALVSADLVVFGEVGGLGTTQIIYLKLIDVRSSREVRGTTLEVGGAGGARGAAYRLLDPNRYRGTLALAVDVQGASVYVNGKLIGKSPVKPLALGVGTHALRVTHPEYRDFVRFVDVDFDRTAEVSVGLQQFPVVQTTVEGVGANIRYHETPAAWYRRWWAVAAFTAVAFTGALLIADFTGCRGVCPKPDYERPIGGPN